MDPSAQRRFDAIRKLAPGDEAYSRLLKENAQLEQRYFDLLQSLPPAQQDAIQDFVMNCEALSWRMLELACTQMRFPTTEEAVQQMRADGASEEYIALFRAFSAIHPPNRRA